MFISTPLMFQEVNEHGQLWLWSWYVELTSEKLLFCSIFHSNKTNFVMTKFPSIDGNIQTVSNQWMTSKKMIKEIVLTIFASVCTSFSVCMHEPTYILSVIWTKVEMIAYSAMNISNKNLDVWDAKLNDWC